MSKAREARGETGCKCIARDVSGKHALAVPTCWTPEHSRCESVVDKGAASRYI